MFTLPSTLAPDRLAVAVTLAPRGSCASLMSAAGYVVGVLWTVCYHTARTRRVLLMGQQVLSVPVLDEFCKTILGATSGRTHVIMSFTTRKGRGYNGSDEDVTF